MSADAIHNIRKASAGRIDVTVEDIPWTLIKAKSEGLDVKVLEPTLAADPQYSYFNPDRADLAEALGAELQKLLDDGTVDSVYQDYLGVSFTEVMARSENALIE